MSRARWPSRSRLKASAHCRSSSSTTSPVAASAPSALLALASARKDADAASAGPEGIPVRSRSSTPASRNARCHGHSGGAAASSGQCPHTTVSLAGSAWRRIASSARVLLPIPAGPASSITPPVPCCAAVIRPAMTDSSAARPTNPSTRIRQPPVYLSTGRTGVRCATGEIPRRYRAMTQTVHGPFSTGLPGGGVSGSPTLARADRRLHRAPVGARVRHPGARTGPVRAAPTRSPDPPPAPRPPAPGRCRASARPRPPIRSAARRSRRRQTPLPVRRRRPVGRGLLQPDIGQVTGRLIQHKVDVPGPQRGQLGHREAQLPGHPDRAPIPPTATTTSAASTPSRPAAATTADSPGRPSSRDSRSASAASSIRHLAVPSTRLARISDR